MDMSEITREDLAALFGFSRDAVCAAERGRIVFANDAAVSLFGRDVTGEIDEDVFPGLALSSDGERFLFSVSVQGDELPVTAVRRGRFLVLTAVRTETRSRGLPESLLHQLRTAVFNLRLSLEHVVPSSAGREDPYEGILFHSYYSMLHLTEQLSDLTELENGRLFCRMQPVELGALCAGLVDSVNCLTKCTPVQILYRIPEEVCHVQADPRKIEQMLLVLLSNSLQHVSAGDRIVLELRRQGKQFILSVDDTGTGMDEGQFSRLFLREDPSPAETTGAGLGLYLAHGIARLHGGTVVMESRPDKGTRVRISLPVRDSLSLRDAAAAEAPGMTLLLTELAPVLPSDVYTARFRD